MDASHIALYTIFRAKHIPTQHRPLGTQTKFIQSQINELPACNPRSMNSIMIRCGWFPERIPSSSLHSTSGYGLQVVGSGTQKTATKIKCMNVDKGQ